MTEEVRLILQEDGPCWLHDWHSPITRFNELHHVFPMALQRRKWGEVRDKERRPICSTGHNTVHGAINHYLDNGTFPGYARGRTRELAQEAITRFLA